MPDLDRCYVHFVSMQTVRRLRGQLLPESQLHLLAATFKMLGDPTRARIIFLLSRQELCVCDLAAVLAMTSSAVSHQLRVLRQLRIVKVRRDGKVAFYSLDDKHIVNLFAECVRHVQEQAPSEQGSRLLRDGRFARGRATT